MIAVQMCCQEVDTHTSSHIEAHPKILIALNAVPSPEEDRVEYVCWFVRVEEDMQAIYVDTGGPLGVQLHCNHQICSYITSQP